MVDKRGKEVLKDCVDDVEEELPLWCLLSEELVREVLLDQVVILDHGEHLEDTQLLNDWHIDEIDLRNTEQVLLTNKDLLDEVFIIVAFLGQIVLTL